MNEAPDLTTRTRHSAVAAAIAVLVIAAAVLVGGWWGGSQFLVRIQPGFAAMVPSTTICLMLCAIAILSLARRPTSRLLPLGAAAAVGVIAGVDFIAYLTLDGRGLDALFLPDLINDADAMALATAVLLFLVAACVVALTLPGRLSPVVFQVMATSGLLAALVALVGYVFDATALYEVFIFTAMALHTAVAFSCLFVSLLLLRPSASWVGLLLGPGAGSISARRLVPVFVLASFAFAFLALILTKRGILNPEFTLSLLAIVMATLASAAMLRNAAIENRSENRLLSTLDDLEAANEEKALLLREVYHRVKNNLQQIGSMLRIEKRIVDDPKLSASFDELADRVRTMGLVHQLLIASRKPSQVDMQGFLFELCQSISTAHNLPAQLKQVATEVEKLEFHLDVAVSVGLLTNELVMNAVKHARPRSDQLTIVVSLKKTAGALVLEVADDGEGSRGAPKIEGTGSLIIRSTVSQLHGSLAYLDGDGTRVVVSIPPDINEQERYV